MAEYIEREKAIAICQSHYEHCLKMHDFSGDSVAYDIRSDIQGLPTADAVEVVRCKDCEHSTLMYGTYVCNNTQSPWFNDVFDINMEANDFCSYGESERRC